VIVILSLTQFRAVLVGWCLAKHHVNVVWTSPPPSPPCCWSMSVLSTHFINAYTGPINPSAFPPFASTSQSRETNPRSQYRAQSVITRPCTEVLMHTLLSSSNINHFSVPDTMRMRFNRQ